MLATDHAPHSPEKKMRELDQAPFGIVGLETLIPITVHGLIEPGHLTWPEVIRKLTINPAQLLGIPKGTLRPGADADVTLIDPEARWTIDPDEVPLQEPQHPLRRLGRPRPRPHRDRRRRGPLLPRGDRPPAPARISPSLLTAIRPDILPSPARERVPEGRPVRGSRLQSCATIRPAADLLPWFTSPASCRPRAGEGSGIETESAAESGGLIGAVRPAIMGEVGAPDTGPTPRPECPAPCGRPIPPA